jgi:hypothetical protein
MKLYLCDGLLTAAIAACLISLSGCATPGLQTQLSSNEVYKLNLASTVNSYYFEGYGVVPSSPSKSYEIKITSATDIDAIIINTCAREEVIESALQISRFGKWLERKKTLALVYTPNDLESTGLCLMQVGTFNRNEADANASAIFDFEDATATLPGLSVCNGDNVSGTHGVTFCETRAGLMQRVSFPVPVIAATTNVSADCKVDQEASSDKTAYDFRTPRDLCVFRYSELTSPFRQHRHVSRGYTKVKIRGT